MSNYDYYKGHLLNIFINEPNNAKMAVKLYVAMYI